MIILQLSTNLVIQFMNTLITHEFLIDLINIIIAVVRRQKEVHERQHHITSVPDVSRWRHTLYRARRNDGRCVLIQVYRGSDQDPDEGPTWGRRAGKTEGVPGCLGETGASWTVLCQAV